MNKLLMPELNIKLKENSHKLVLDTIRKEKAISGADIARRTNLQPSTILYILRALKKNELIEKSGKGESTDKGGKRPTLWRLNPNKGIIIGIEVLPERIITSISDFKGDILSQNEKAYSLFTKENDMLDAILNCVNSTIDSNLNKQVLGVGIAITGIVDGEKGELIYSNKMQFKNVLIKDFIEEKTQLPVYLINGANAGALEVQILDNSSACNIIYLTYSEDVLNLGAGIVINGNMYEGSSGTSGEMFNRLPELEKLYKDALSTVKTEEPLVNEMRNNNKKVSLKQINKNYINNCKVSEYILKSLCKFIASEILWIIGFINPELVVIGGDLDSESDVIEKYITPELQKYITENDYKDYIIPEIKFSKYGKYSISMGAVALIWQRILQN